MTTLWDVAKEMTYRAPGDDAIGRVAAITSLTTLTAVSSALAFGGNSENRYAQQWVWRGDTTTVADKTRYSDSFAPATGTLTHSGTNYSDTTATDESMLIGPHEPHLVREAIDLTVRQLRRLDRTELPTRQGVNRYFIGDLDWIESPEDIVKVSWCDSPLLTRNRYIVKRNSVDTAGALIPDNWTLANAATGSGYSTAQTWKELPYSYLLERSTTDATMTQTISLLDAGISGESIRGETVTAFARVWSDTASKVRIQILESGSVVDSSSYHTGGSGWEELTVSYTILTTATSLSMRASVEVDAGNAYIGEMGAAIETTMTDAIRRDNYIEYDLPRDQFHYDQNGVLSILVPPRGKKGQWIVYSKRPYPGFDSARLISGAADADSTDAPLVTVACGAIARLFKGKAMGDVQSADWVRAKEWEDKFATLANKLLYVGKDSLDDRLRLPRIGPGIVRMR